MKPFSATYYLRNNKGRAALVIFMLFLTVLMFIAGNYLASNDWYWEKNIEYDEKIASVGCLPTDEDSRDFHAVLEDIRRDPKLKMMEYTGYGFGGLSWICTIGIEMGSSSFIFKSKADMEAAFKRLGLEIDLSKIRDGSMVISEAMAKNHGLKLGDTVDATVDKGLNGTYTLDALLDNDCFTTFYLVEDETNLARAYVYSEEMEGDALYGYIRELIGSRMVKLNEQSKYSVKRSLAPLKVILIAGAFLLSVILAVTVNSVVNGQYQKRVYEFAVYRALGISKKGIFGKCAKELLLMDGIAILTGSAVHFLTTFLLNELYYRPNGRFLPYVSWLGLTCFLIANLTVMIPMLISKGRRMGKADVTEF